MLKAIPHVTRALWFAMAILGQREMSREIAEKTDSKEEPSGSVSAVKVVASRGQTGPLPRDANYLAASFDPGDDDALPDNLPAPIVSELKSIDAMRHAIETGEPIERWRFETVKTRYETFLKKNSGEPAIDAAVRARVARLARFEDAANAARAIQTILAQSHRRDREVIEFNRQLHESTANKSGSRSYQAVGFMHPSAQKLDGRKLFVLIGKNGATVAFLDIPPGLDANPALARRVGVRGVSHYSEDLQSRLITVRDLETIESRR